MTDTRTLTRLTAILSRLDSPYDGERAAAGLLASRELRKLGLTWDELVAPRRLPAPAGLLNWRNLARQCLRHHRDLTDIEAGFLASLGGFPRISEKQRAWLERIAARLGVAVQ